MRETVQNEATVLVLRAKQAAATFLLNKDGGTMYIPFALSYKNALRIKLRDEIVF